MVLTPNMVLRSGSRKRNGILETCSRFGWFFDGSVRVPAVATADPTPPPGAVIADTSDDTFVATFDWVTVVVRPPPTTILDVARAVCWPTGLVCCCCCCWTRQPDVAGFIELPFSPFNIALPLSLFGTGLLLAPFVEPLGNIELPLDCCCCVESVSFCCKRGGKGKISDLILPSHTFQYTTTSHGDIGWID